jgi:hypothetical protein
MFAQRVHTAYLTTERWTATPVLRLSLPLLAALRRRALWECRGSVAALRLAMAALRCTALHCTALHCTALQSLIVKPKVTRSRESQTDGCDKQTNTPVHCYFALRQLGEFAAHRSRSASLEAYSDSLRAVWLLAAHW